MVLWLGMMNRKLEDHEWSWVLPLPSSEKKKKVDIIGVRFHNMLTFGGQKSHFNFQLSLYFVCR